MVRIEIICKRQCTSTNDLFANKRKQLSFVDITISHTHIMHIIENRVIDRALCDLVKLSSDITLSQINVRQY